MHLFSNFCFFLFYYLLPPPPFRLLQLFKHITTTLLQWPQKITGGKWVIESPQSLRFLIRSDSEQLYFQNSTIDLHRFLSIALFSCYKPDSLPPLSKNIPCHYDMNVERRSVKIVFASLYSVAFLDQVNPQQQNDTGGEGGLYLLSGLHRKWKQRGRPKIGQDT
jgi:hypothetical protein